jgi:hypothetical protein
MESQGTGAIEAIKDEQETVHQKIILLKYGTQW